jgi:hypothetical protein
MKFCSTEPAVDQIKNLLKGAREFEALRRLRVALGQIGIMCGEDAGDLAVAPKTLGTARDDGHLPREISNLKEVPQQNDGFEIDMDIP